ncbi:unnamed protein product, partial [Mesorhabditis spiculigera]
MHLRILCIILALSMVDSICCRFIRLSRSTTDNDIDASTEAYSFDLTSEESNDFTDDAKRFNHPMPTKYDRNCWFSPLGCLYPKGVTAGSPHKMTASLKVHNPTPSTMFYRVYSSHSVYYSLYVSPVSGKLLPGQSVEIQFVLPSIASVRHSAQPLHFVLQSTTASANSDMRTFWRYVDLLDIVEMPIRVRIMPFEEDIWNFHDTEASSSEDEPVKRKKPKEVDEKSGKAELSLAEEARHDVIIRLITENRSLRARVLSLEKAEDYYDQVLRRHTELVEENSRLRSRVDKLEISQVPFNCCVCLEEKPNTILYPCRHIVMCRNCASNSGSRCPMCRTVITQKAAVYF